MVAAPSTAGIAVLAAGPAGLTAAHLLGSRGNPGVVFEADSQVGGIAKTVEHDGFRFDLGGHRFFTKEPWVEEMWEETLGDEFLLRPRLSRRQRSSVAGPTVAGITTASVGAGTVSAGSRRGSARAAAPRAT